MNAIGVKEIQRLALDFQDITNEVAAIVNAVAAMQNGQLNVNRLLQYRNFLWQFEKMRMYQFPNKPILANGQTIPNFIASLDPN